MPLHEKPMSEPNGRVSWSRRLDSQGNACTCKMSDSLGPPAQQGFVTADSGGSARTVRTCMYPQQDSSFPYKPGIPLFCGPLALRESQPCPLDVMERKKMARAIRQGTRCIQAN